MNDYQPVMPHIDDTVTPDNLHERAEQIAMPNFDWINQPIRAVVDGLLHIPPTGQEQPGPDRSA